MKRDGSIWVRIALVGFSVALSASLAGCAFQPADSDPQDEDVTETNEELTVAPADNGPDPGQDVETGEGNDPSPQPWKTRAVVPTPGSPDPAPYDPAAARATTTNTTTGK